MAKKAYVVPITTFILAGIYLLWFWTSEEEIAVFDVTITTRCSSTSSPCATPTPSIDIDQPQTSDFRLSPNLTVSAIIALNTQSNKTCPTKNVDIFLVAEQRTFPLVEWTIRSIELFMPCRGTIHIVCEPGEATEVLSWIGRQDNIMIYEMKRPTGLAKASSYHMMQWPQFWADKYVSPAADYVMFLDSDSILTMPITCGALFTPSGKIYLPAWKKESTPQFFQLCREALGQECVYNFMNYYPFLFPARLLGPLREHMTRQMKSRNFNAIIAQWDSTPPPLRKGQILSQFVIFGNYLLLFYPALVEVPLCFPVQEIQAKPTNCRDYVHPGVHYGWRPCNYLGACTQRGYYLFEGDGRVFSKKFDVGLMKHISEILVQNSCFMFSLISGASTTTELNEGGCTKEKASTLHPETLSYQTLPVNMDIQRHRFAPDTFSHLCPSVHLRTADTKMYQDKDDMYA